MTSIGDYNEIMSDRNLFNKTVYTPLSEAIKILEERQKDPILKAKIEKLLNGDIPEPLKQIGRHGVLFRQIATPNFETKWFIELTKDYNIETNFFEFNSDKFTSNNYFKRSLGQLRIHKNKVNKNGNNIEEKIIIIDFNKNNGKKLKDIKTFWSESLIDFHRKLFLILDYNIKTFYFWDASKWFKENGGNAVNYYTNMLLLFMYHGILFENFLFTESEGEFTKNILLPSFEKVYSLTELKPLIVPIPPMDEEIEEDMHWHSFSPKIKSLIN